MGQSLTYYLAELRGLTRIPDRYEVPTFLSMHTILDASTILRASAGACENACFGLIYTDFQVADYKAAPVDCSRWQLTMNVKLQLMSAVYNLQSVYTIPFSFKACCTRPMPNWRFYVGLIFCTCVRLAVGLKLQKYLIEFLIR